MTFNTNSASHGSMQTASQTHRTAAHIHEKASKHHYEAARLHEKGDHQQAMVHANIAADHAVEAVETGANTLGP